MHIDTDKALAWLDQLRGGVENSNSLAEDVVTRAMAAADLFGALNNIKNAIDTGAITVTTDQDETWANALGRMNSALAKAKGEQS